MGGEWFQVQAQMVNASLPTAKKACLELISCKCMKRAGGTVNVTQRTLFAPPCADVATRIMSSDLLNRNLLINLLDNSKSSLDATV